MPVDVAPDEPPNKMRWLRVARAISSHNIMHGQPHVRFQENQSMQISEWSYIKSGVFLVL
ncbi:MAG TPA: hypothetical protein EYG81_00335 [Archaeoglobus profundus]|nr:hypothetical protein [Archaeoglobus profundus]